MHFAKRLQRDAVQLWGDSYIAYKDLKKAIKQIEAENSGCLRSETEFARHLRTEMNKVSAKYTEQCTHLERLLKDLEEGTGPDCENARLRRVLNTVVIPLLNQLRGYVALNTTAVVKIVKKWNKTMRSKTGSSLDATAMLLGHKVVLGFNIGS
eukprot:6389787-Pyramimonas_sp.AAC.1